MRRALERIDELGVVTRHAVARCSVCGELAAQPARTTRDGSPSTGRRCFLTPGCSGSLVVPSIARRPRARKVAVDPVPLVDPAVSAAAQAAIDARSARSVTPVRWEGPIGLADPAIERLLADLRAVIARIDVQVGSAGDEIAPDRPLEAS